MASNKDMGYHTKEDASFVDETLFQSCYKPSLYTHFPFESPWDKKSQTNQGDRKPTTQRPLIWAPSPRPVCSGMDHYADSHYNTNNNTEEGMMSQPKTLKGLPMKYQYRKLTHTPTFVDETLFGEQMPKPSFKAPWENRCVQKQILQCDIVSGDGKPMRRRHAPAFFRYLNHSTVSGTVWKP